jgi:hypothetical protein
MDKYTFKDMLFDALAVILIAGGSLALVVFLPIICGGGC